MIRKNMISFLLMSTMASSPLLGLVDRRYRGSEIIGYSRMIAPRPDVIAVATAVHIMRHHPQCPTWRLERDILEKDMRYRESRARRLMTMALHIHLNRELASESDVDIYHSARQATLLASYDLRQILRKYDKLYSDDTSRVIEETTSFIDRAMNEDMERLFPSEWARNEAHRRLKEMSISFEHLSRDFHENRSVQHSSDFDRYGAENIFLSPDTYKKKYSTIISVPGC